MMVDGEREELGAAEAFEALRSEVAGLREELRVALERSAGGGGVDYAPTLGAIVKRLAVMEAHPALRLSPSAFGQALRDVERSLQQRGEARLVAVIQRIENGAFQIERIAGRARAPRAQRRGGLGAVGVGVFAGVLGWVALSGPVARAMPASWALPEKMAAATLAQGRWEAGARMMRSYDGLRWSEVVEAEVIYQLNQKALKRCLRTPRRPCAVALVLSEPT
jgi:hypothetical protein